MIAPCKVRESEKHLPCPAGLSEDPTLLRFSKLCTATAGEVQSMASWVNYRGTEEERFWNRVLIRESGCWEWGGGKDSHGYGAFSLARTERGKLNKTIRAHEFSYLYCVGPKPRGKELDHLCRNPLCVNPAHLEPVPHRINILRGESPFAKHARQTHCKHGHEFTPGNIYWAKHKNGQRHRVCRVCTLQRQKRKYQERKRISAGRY